jgi:predicted small secreted protein
MKSLELEIRSYIIIFSVTFMIALLSGCGNTISGVGKDISDVGNKISEWQK